MKQKTLVGLMAVVLAATAGARTIYDAGKALRQNCTAAENAYANPYTDENGGVWSYDRSDANGTWKGGFDNHGTFTHNMYGGANGAVLAGFTMSNTEQGRSVRVNISGKSVRLGSGETLEPDELVMFPAASDNQYAHVRFAAPETGWYSAFVSAHDLVRGDTAAGNGVDVRVLSQGKCLVSQLVSLEDLSGAVSTHRFDFQMPIRHLAAGEKIDVVVGWNGVNANDNTGVKFVVTKEDEGAFYDSGIAMTNCVADAATYTNPYGTIRDGTWYFLKATVPSQTVDFVTWAPGNFGHGLTSRITATGKTSGNLPGFGAANGTTIKSPFVVVNTNAAVYGGTAPGELQAHPNGSNSREWTTIRFRPPASGYYTGSVVARDANKGGVDGVDVYLLVSEEVVTNAYISAETYSSTTHLAFERRLLVAGEPVDIVVSPHTNVTADATSVSAIFRREPGDVYDAGKSFYACHAAGSSAHPFEDVLGGGATWDLGAKTNAWCGSQFYSMPAFGLLTGTTMSWWLYGANAVVSTYPMIALASNGLAKADSTIGTGADLLAVTPQEFVMRPNTPGYRSSSPTLKANIPSDGIYRARTYARDLNNNTSNGVDGVVCSIAVHGHVPVSGSVFREANSTYPYEAAFGAERLWLKAGDKLEFVVNPGADRTYDATGFTACYVLEDVATPHVVNVDFATATGLGKFSSHSGRGREGWSDWNKWNALRAGSAMVKNCTEADGATKRNVAVSIARDSGAAIATVAGSGASALLNNYVSSSGTADTYTFTISNLTANELYTLYLYSAKATATGNAMFTVGGVTKGVENTWSLGETKMLTRFGVTSDANGVITGTFAAADSNGGAFNGLTLVGDLPDYVEAGTILVIR